MFAGESKERAADSAQNLAGAQEEERWEVSERNTGEDKEGD